MLRRRVLRERHRGRQRLDQVDVDQLVAVLRRGDVVVEADRPIELAAPAIIGEMGILSEAPRNASIRCTKWCTVIILPAHIIRVCLQQNPSMQEWMTSLVDARLSKSGGDDEPQ